MADKLNIAISGFIIAAGIVLAPLAKADGMGREAIYADMQKVFGGVPTFVKSVPDAALTGLWQQSKDLELSGKTALSAKEKALISLAVASQIPCSYCIVADTASAKRAGATEQEIGEAVAMAGLTRNWSTMFQGLQVDFDQFKKEMAASE
jgi:AhpD family alkylhydroperoxidase